MTLRVQHWGLSFIAAALLATSALAQNSQGPQGREAPEGATKGDTQQSGSEPPHHNSGPTGDATPAVAPIGSGPETTPAKFDAAVAARDRIPIMARPLPLNDEQKRQIYDRVMGNEQIPVTQTTAAQTATILPGSVELSELSPPIDEQIPAVRGYKYVKLPDRVLVVSPPNCVVVGEIRR